MIHDYIYSLLETYITIDNVVIVGVVVASCLVAYSFWGKSWLMEQRNKLTKDSEKWVNQQVKENEGYLIKLAKGKRAWQEDDDAS